MRYIITMLVLCVCCTIASADVIYFKDGGHVEGIIKEQDEEKTVVDVGSGTMTVSNDDIEYIEPASPEELARLQKVKLDYEISTGQWAPPGYDGLRAVYVRARDGREELREAKRKSKGLKVDIAERESVISEYLEALDLLGEKLKEIDPEENVQEYNNIVTEINSVNSDMARERTRIKGLYDDEKKLNRRLGSLVNKYRSDFTMFKEVLASKERGGDVTELNEDEDYFLGKMASRLTEMTSDFRQDTADYKADGEQIIVDVLLNGSVLARLMLDTGASIVLITSDVANRLGIDYDSIKTEIDIVLADDTTSKAKPVVLKSVKVGDAVIENVQAAIIDTASVGGVDGLLGMSFLSNFILKVDSANNKLILERVL